MPASIVELQRRLTLVGAIRAGAEKAERGPGRRLEAFRLTSPRRQLIEQAAGLYGGEPKPWASPVGEEFQLYTTAQELPVLVMPGYSLQQSYELWTGATKRERLCDGIDEALSESPCLCNAAGEDLCDLYTRLVVALPELDTVLGWRLITRGANAGHELPTMFALIEQVAAGQAFVPARLRLDERRGVKDGQVVRYVVPSLDLGVGYLSLVAPDRNHALPSRSPNYEPAPIREANVTEALSAVTQAPPPRPQTARSSAPIGPEGAPEPEAEPIPIPSADAGYQEERQTKALTGPQAKKLNVLVGQLRDAGHITTEQLWNAIAQLREVEDAEEMVAELGGRDDENVLHWSPLRESLTRPEAVQLIDWLEIKQARVTQGSRVPF